MWPMLLNMTRDDCRRTLRRLELEAYSNMIGVFRAQGALEDNRKKLLEELRGVLHISNDRHTAEARRVANDEILATIAEQLAGPNTGMGWVFEGRRLVPLMPRGIPQTAYTEIADKAAQAAAAENKQIQKRLENEKLVAPKSNEEELPEAEGVTAEGALTTDEALDEFIYPPIVMEDQTTKIWETEMMNRKRKIPEGGNLPEDNAATPTKNIRNIIVNSNQKHPNLSQLYSKYAQTTPSKQQQTKHSYNQVGKVSNKSNSTPKQRQKQNKHSQIVLSKSQVKKSQELSVTPTKPYNKSEYNAPPNSFQASYAQSVLGNKSRPDYMDDIKSKMVSPPGMMTDSPTMQLLTQPATVPHELAVSDGAHPDDPTSQAQATPAPKVLSGKPCHLIIKKRGDEKKIPMSELKVLQKTPETIKLLSSRPVVVAQGSTHKTGGKMVPTKVISQLPKSHSTPTVLSSDKMIVVSKPERSLSSSKIIISSSTPGTPANKPITVSSSSISPKTFDNVSAKGLPATDLKVSAKTFLLNPKSGQKMVVLPKRTTKTEGQNVPVLHFKSIPTTMKLVSVSSQPVGQLAKSPSVTVVSKSSMANVVPASNAKITGVEPIKTANMADIVPVKGLQPIISTPKSANPIVRPTSGKGGVIVVQKGATLGKTISFTKNGNDMSKIIMGKNVNQLLQASALKQDQKESPAAQGNVIVLELNNESARTTTMSKILESHTAKPAHVEGDAKQLHEKITVDTPVLFDNQIVEEACNANSLDSAAESIGDGVEATLSLMHKETKVEAKSNVTDWEMELRAVTTKGKDDDKLNSLHLDLGMSSDSDTEYVVSSHKAKSKHSPQESIQRPTPGGESFGSSVGLTHASRLLLSQLQDDGSSSNDSSFALGKARVDKLKKDDPAIEKSESEALNKAKEKLSEKVAEANSRRRRIDIYSTAISSSDMNLDPFSYLEEGMMAGDEMFAHEAEGKGLRDSKDPAALDMQLSQLLGEEAAPLQHSVSESLPLSKQ